MTTDELELAGRFLLGNEWKRPLAKLLGPYHPDGHRDSLDPRLPFRWASGGRPIPRWVEIVLGLMLERRVVQLQSMARDAERLAEDLARTRELDGYVDSVVSRLDNP